jgi:hypothetical protein
MRLTFPTREFLILVALPPVFVGMVPLSWFCRVPGWTSFVLDDVVSTMVMPVVAFPLWVAHGTDLQTVLMHM